MSKPTCNWCHPTAGGDYSIYEFKHPTEPERKATVSVYGGTFAVEIKTPEDDTNQRLSFPILYCPFCGRSFDGTGGGNDD